MTILNVLSDYLLQVKSYLWFYHHYDIQQSIFLIYVEYFHKFLFFFLGGCPNSLCNKCNKIC